jgi:hypothetical protein
VTQHWKSALTGAAVVILSATAGAGSASAHQFPAMAKTAAAAPADRLGDCVAHLSIRHDPSFGYEIGYGGSSSDWAPPGFLRITAVLIVDGHREGSVSDARRGRNVDTPTGTDFRRSIRSATVTVGADGPAGSVSCHETSRM